jgi:hypothetical protein
MLWKHREGAAATQLRKNSKKKSFFTRNVVEKLGESTILCFDIDHFNINLRFYKWRDPPVVIFKGDIDDIG